MLGIKHHAASVETGLSWADAEFMQVQHRTLHLPCPAWAASDEKVRRVVAAKLCVLIRKNIVPDDLKALREEIEPRVMAQLQKNALPPDAKESQQHLCTVIRCGGPLAFWTSLCYRRFRLGQNSVELARIYGVKPVAIRQQTFRLSLIARVLFPDPEEHLPRHHSAGPLRGFKTLRRVVR
jgi:hypothetical protein